MDSTLQKNLAPFLEHFSEATGRNVHRIRVAPLPFRIGRGNTCNYVLKSEESSKTHAEFVVCDGTVILRDLKSTNGTFVNGKRIAEVELKHDDVIHVARDEFRFFFGQADLHAGSDSAVFTKPGADFGVNSIGRTRQFLREMVSGCFGHAVFQPIVGFECGQVQGFEALARGTHGMLKFAPAELFAVAEQCGMAVNLSEMFRRLSIAEAERLPGSPKIFLNVHPFEIDQDGLSAGCQAFLRQYSRQRQIVLELNEEAVLSLPVLQKVNAQVREFGAQLAFDDFGAGQARLVEFSHFPPDYLKLDMGLVRNIHLSSVRQAIVKALASTCHLMGVKIIAEGVETIEEAETCRSLGCLDGQGYYFGKPDVAMTFFDSADPRLDETIEQSLMPTLKHA